MRPSCARCCGKLTGKPLAVGANGGPITRCGRTDAARNPEPRLTKPNATFLNCMKPFSAADDANLREVLRHYSATTYLAAREFRKTGKVEHLHGMIDGILAGTSGPKPVTSSNKRTITCASAKTWSWIRWK